MSSRRSRDRAVTVASTAALLALALAAAALSCARVAPSLPLPGAGGGGGTGAGLGGAPGNRLDGRGHDAVQRGDAEGDLRSGEDLDGGLFFGVRRSPEYQRDG